MTWLSFALGLINIVNSLVGYMREKKLIDLGGEAQIAKALRRQVDEIEKANKARDDAERNARAAVGVPDDDGFRRD